MTHVEPPSHVPAHKGLLPGRCELGKFKRLVAELPNGSPEILAELARLLAPRKAIAAVLESHGYKALAGKAKLESLFHDLLIGGAGQRVGTTYVPAAALYDPKLLNMLLATEATQRAAGANRRTIATNLAWQAITYCETDTS
jgi:hypothetical protein